MYGTADDVQVAIGDIIRGQLNHQAPFEAFQIEIAAGGAPQKGS